MAKYILYGNVRCKTLCELTELFVQKNGGEVLFYVDDNSIDGNRVFSSDLLIDYPNAIVVILVSMPYKVIDNMRRRGFENKVFIAPLLGYRFIIENYMSPSKYAAFISNWSIENKIELMSLYNLEDEYTKQLLAQRLEESKAFGLVEVEKYKYYVWEDYFSDEIISPSLDITYVDCGAYIGDSLQSIIHLYGEKVRFCYLLEPDINNYDDLCRVVSELNMNSSVKLINKGCYDYNGYLSFTKVNDELEQNINGDIKIPVVKLDDEIDCVDGTLCIKMDLEGSECAAIRGASEIIRKYRPYMAICVYHKINDILEVPMIINQIAEGYKFYLRGGLHTEVYAVPL